jgi:hypothetical protein
MKELELMLIRIKLEALITERDLLNATNQGREFALYGEDSFGSIQGRIEELAKEAEELKASINWKEVFNMAWIAFHGAIIRRLKKFHDFRRMVGWEELAAAGFLGSLWSEVLELRESGDISDWSATYICNDLLKINTSESEKIVEALIACEWLDRKTDKQTGEVKVLIHDWIDYAGKYLQRKYKSNQHETLTRIWMLHGLKYGKDGEGFHQEAFSVPSGRVHNIDNIDNIDNTNTGKGTDPESGEEDPKAKEKALQEEQIRQVMDHFNQECKAFCPKGLKLTEIRKGIIKKRLFDDKISLDDLKKAITNFSKDDWQDRGKYCDIVYAIGIRNKADNFEKWVNYSPKGKRYAAGQETDQTDKFAKNGFSS